jgi:hypothetical protein
MPSATIETPDKVQAFITRARKQWKTAADAEKDNRADAYEDLQFLNLEQWSAGIKELRSQPGREKPCLTIDQIGEPFRQLTNKQRESRPAIHINPEDGDANQATADVLQGLVRAIEYDSDAQIAYATAFEGAVGIGWGYARLRSEFDGDGPDQNLVIDMIENPFSVYLDPGTRKWDRSDARYGFVIQDIPKDQYIALYGESAVAKAGASLSDFSALGDEAQDWFPEGAVRVAEYYYIEDQAVILGELNGKTIEEKDAPKGAKLENRREIRRPKVMWAKINGLEILEGNDTKDAGRRIPGKSIPVRACFGQVLNVNGKRVYRGIVRAAKDAQRQYNYQNSELALELALAPKAKAVMAEGQDEGYEQMWDNANIEAYPRLIYKPTTIGDKVTAPPSVVQFTDPAKIQAIVVAINQAKQDLRSTTGWYDATDPTRKNADQSGKAILARKQSQDQGSVNYLDNFNRFVTSLGKLTLEWIPELYDREGRIIRTLGMEDEVERVMINVPYREDGEEMVPVEEGAAKLMQDVKHFVLTKGRYGVRVSPGTSYTTRKQEAAEWQFRILEARPELMQVFGDIAFKNLDGPGHEQIAQRIANTIPPQIKGDEEGKVEIPPEVQQQVAAMQMQMQAMQVELAEKSRALEANQVKAEYDLAKSREDNETKWKIERLKAEVAAMQARVELITAQASVDADLAKANLEAETKRLLALADLNVSMEQETMRQETARQQKPKQRESVN